jgi:hypothetical protein
MSPWLRPHLAVALVSGQVFLIRSPSPIARIKVPGGGKQKTGLPPFRQPGYLNPRPVAFRPSFTAGLALSLILKVVSFKAHFKFLVKNYLQNFINFFGSEKIFVGLSAWRRAFRGSEKQKRLRGAQGSLSSD